jgi:hypothetical protein
MVWSCGLVWSGLVWSTVVWSGVRIYYFSCTIQLYPGIQFFGPFYAMLRHATHIFVSAVHKAFNEWSGLVIFVAMPRHATPCHTTP